MSDPTPEEITRALDALPRLPQVPTLLNAGMDAMEMVALARDTEKYQMDTDFHILIDTVHSLLTTIGVLEQEMIAIQEQT